MWVANFLSNSLGDYFGRRVLNGTDDSSDDDDDDDVLPAGNSQVERCIEILKGVLGDTVPRRELVRVTVAADCDPNRALNFYFSWYKRQACATYQVWQGRIIYSGSLSQLLVVCVCDVNRRWCFPLGRLYASFTTINNRERWDSLSVSYLNLPCVCAGFYLLIN